jgi:hypothetical protein
MQEVFVDPVVGPDGHTYERRALERWLRENDTSPKTGARFPPGSVLVANHAMRSTIEEMIEREHPNGGRTTPAKKKARV